MTKDQQIAKLEATVAELKLVIKSQQEKITMLLDLLSKQVIRKDSHNSSNPPSQDKSKPKRNQSLRKKTSRKSGGQPGHKGHTLEMRAVPDAITELRSDYCSVCGSSLARQAHWIKARRQVVDIPSIQPRYTEYQQFACTCCCGHEQVASYPAYVKAPIQYGKSI